MFQIDLDLLHQITRLTSLGNIIIQKYKQNNNNYFNEYEINGRNEISKELDRIINFWVVLKNSITIEFEYDPDYDEIEFKTRALAHTDEKLFYNPKNPKNPVYSGIIFKHFEYYDYPSDILTWINKSVRPDNREPISIFDYVIIKHRPNN